MKQMTRDSGAAGEVSGFVKRRENELMTCPGLLKPETRTPSARPAASGLDCLVNRQRNFPDWRGMPEMEVLVVSG